MGMHLHLLLALLLSGCAVTKSFYLPYDPGLRREGTTCGSVPFGSANLTLPHGVGMSVFIVPASHALSVGLQLTIPEGVTVRFSTPAMLLDAGGLQPVPVDLRPFTTSVYRRAAQAGHIESFLPSESLVGRARNNRPRGA